MTTVDTVTHGYMVAIQGGRTVGIAEENGNTGWDVYAVIHPRTVDEPIASGLTADQARDKLRTLPRTPQ